MSMNSKAIISLLITLSIPLYLYYVYFEFLYSVNSAETCLSRAAAQQEHRVHQPESPVRINRTAGSKSLRPLYFLYTSHISWSAPLFGCIKNPSRQLLSSGQRQIARFPLLSASSFREGKGRKKGPTGRFRVRPRTPFVLRERSM